MTRRTWILALFLHVTAATAVASPSDLDLATFLENSNRLALEIRSSNAADALAIRDRLPRVWVVRHEDDRFEVPTTALAKALNAAAQDAPSWHSRRMVAAAVVVALRTEAATLQRSSKIPARSTADAALQAVLSAPEFHSRRPWLADLGKEIRKWLTDLAAGLGLGRASSARATRIVVWLVIAASAAALVLWLRSMLRRARPAPRSLGVGCITPHGASRDWIARANAAARQADAREVVHCAYQAVVARLEEDGAWRVDPTRTPREYLRLLRTNDRRRGAVADATRRFEKVWYGGVAPAPDDATEMLRRLRELGCELPAELAI